jgi:hypothetical protein
VARIDTQTDVGLHARIEADVAGLASQLDSFRGRVDLAALDELSGVLVLLAVTSHLELLVSVSPAIRVWTSPWRGVHVRHIGAGLSEYLPDNLDAHAAGSAFDLGHGSVEVVGV